jgi:hypothetical protein
MRCERSFIKPLLVAYRRFELRAEDLIPDDSDAMQIGETEVRKGTVAAFAYNATALERLGDSSTAYEDAANEIRRIVPKLAAVGFFEVFEPRLGRARALVSEFDPGLLD